MNPIRFYDAVTGVFTPNSMQLGNPDDLEANTPEGFVAIACAVDHLSQRMDIASGELVAYEPPAEAVEQVARRARSTRDYMLSACDWVVSRAIERDEPVPAEWIAYRQALRDITGQVGFPKQVIWPEAPT